MQIFPHHAQHASHGLLRESEQYMPGHGLGSHTGHDEQAGHTVDMFRIAFGFSLLLTLPVILWDPAVQALFGYQLHDYIGHNLTPALFATAVFYYGGQIFMRGAYRELRDHQPGMMVLLSLAIGITFLYSAMALAGFPGQPLWLQLALLITLLLFGNWLDLWSITHADRAIDQLDKLLPATALRLLADEQVEEISLAHLRTGHLLLVQPGERIPADGTLECDSAVVEEAMLTGAGEPVPRQRGDAVLAGSLNRGDSALRIRVTDTASHSVLAAIKRQVERVLSQRSRTQALADRTAYLLTILTVAAAGVTLLLWLMMGESLQFSVTRMIAVLVIAAPQALGLALPLVFAVATTRAVRSGMLVQDRRALEEARRINIVIFDEGTLTQGELRVLETVTSDGLAPTEALRLAAAVERSVDHPLAQVLRAAAHGMTLPPSQQTTSLHGLGIEATVEGRTLAVAGSRLLLQQHIVLPEVLARAAERFHMNNLLTACLLEEGRPLALFAIADPLRIEAYEAVEHLHRQGIEVALFSSEKEDLARQLAGRLGIDMVYAQLSGEQKAQKLCHLQEQGKRVAFVGAGYGDSACMMVADISIAFAAGPAPSESNSDLALLHGDPRGVARFLGLGRRLHRRLLENIGWAVLYNLIAIPLAAGLMIGAGLLPSPVVAALLMATSTAVVALNAQRIGRD